MDSFRFDSRLFLVMALFGILSTRVILTEGDTTAESMSASTASQDTTVAPAEDISTSGTLNTAVASSDITEVTGTHVTVQKTTLGADLTTTGNQVTSEILSLPSQTELYTTGETGNHGETATIFTETSSTSENLPAAPAHFDGTGTTKDSEKTTATMEQTKESTANMQHATSLINASTDRPTETTATGKEQKQSTTVISSTALSGDANPCERLDLMKINCSSTIFNINGSICKHNNSYSYRKRSLDKSQKYTHSVVLDIAEESNPHEVKKMSKNYTSEKECQNCSFAVAKYLLANWTADKNSTGIIRREQNGVIIIDVSKPMMLHEMMNYLDDGFKHVITGNQTPDDSSSSATNRNLDGNSVSDGRVNIWEAHLGLFLTVIILISVCIVITFMCFLCMKWRGRGRDKHPDKQPISMEEAREAPTAVSNPIPDAEMIQDEAPMQERENPAVTPNGGGQHISKADEDNGWVVPLDELSKAEKEKPEVENTRL